MNIFSFVWSAGSDYFNFNTPAEVDTANFGLKVKYELFTALKVKYTLDMHFHIYDTAITCLFILL